MNEWMNEWANEWIDDGQLNKNKKWMKEFIVKKNVGQRMQLMKYINKF